MDAFYEASFNLKMFRMYIEQYADILCKVYLCEDYIIMVQTEERTILVDINDYKDIYSMTIDVIKKLREEQ